MCTEAKVYYLQGIIPPDSMVDAAVVAQVWLKSNVQIAIIKICQIMMMTMTMYFA